MIKRKKDKGGDNGRWLLTYSDLITLLMIFFVVMYAMSNVNSTKYQNLSSSLFSALNWNKSGGGSSIIGSDNGPSITKGTKVIVPGSGAIEERNFKEIQKEVNNYIKKNKLENSVQAQIEDKGLVIRFNEALLFDIAKADIKPDFKNNLEHIGKFLNTINNFIRVEGYSDNVPINNDVFHSNWELSAIRATNVTQFLINECGIAPSRLSAVGYGEYRPIASNATSEGRAKNRRVDIVILKNKFSETEQNKK